MDLISPRARGAAERERDGAGEEPFARRGTGQGVVWKMKWSVLLAMAHQLGRGTGCEAKACCAFRREGRLRRQDWSVAEVGLRGQKLEVLRGTG